MSGPRMLSTIAILIAIMCTALAVSASSTVDAGHLVIRWTARTSLILFLLAYVARPLTQLRPRPWAKTLLARRKWLGLGFATSHAFHLGGIITLAAPDPGAFIRAQDPSIVIALATFVLIFAMAITSIDRVRKAMPARAWKRLHRTGMHTSWVVFATSYAGALGASPLYAVPALAVLAAGTLRLAAWRRGRTRAVAIG